MCFQNMVDSSKVCRHAVSNRWHHGFSIISGVEILYFAAKIILSAMKKKRNKYKNY